MNKTHTHTETHTHTDADTDTQTLTFMLYVWTVVKLFGIDTIPHSGPTPDIYSLESQPRIPLSMHAVLLCARCGPLDYSGPYCIVLDY